MEASNRSSRPRDAASPYGRPHPRQEGDRSHHHSGSSLRRTHPFRCVSVLESAIANARVKADKAGELFRENDLVVKETYVDEGVTLKRFRARAQGRAARINKRTSHITVVVANKEGNR